MAVDIEKEIAKILATAAHDFLNEVSFNVMQYRKGGRDADVAWRMDDAVRWRAKADIVQRYLKQMGADPELLKRLHNELVYTDFHYGDSFSGFGAPRGWWEDRMERIIEECKAYERGEEQCAQEGKSGSGEP